MSEIKKRLGFNPNLPSEAGEIPEDVTLIRELSDELYSSLSFKNEPGDSPLVLGEFRIINGKVFSSKMFELNRPGEWEIFWRAEGEILLQGPVSIDKIRGLRSYEWIIRYWSRGLIYAEAPGISARFIRASEGVYNAEIVADLSSWETLYKLRASF